MEWNLALRDGQAQMSALQKGEVDIIESLPFEFFEAAKKDPNLQLPKYATVNLQYMARFNHLNKPFDNPKVRQAMYKIINQEDFLRTVVGNPAYYKVCHGLITCGSPLETTLTNSAQQLRLDARLSSLSA